LTIAKRSAGLATVTSRCGGLPAGMKRISFKRSACSSSNAVRRWPK
jgi:hypothetical protein